MVSGSFISSARIRAGVVVGLGTVIGVPGTFGSLAINTLVVGVSTINDFNAPNRPAYKPVPVVEVAGMLAPAANKLIFLA